MFNLDLATNITGRVDVEIFNSRGERKGEIHKKNTIVSAFAGGFYNLLNTGTGLDQFHGPFSLVVELGSSGNSFTIPNTSLADISTSAANLEFQIKTDDNFNVPTGLTDAAISKIRLHGSSVGGAVGTTTSTTLIGESDTNDTFPTDDVDGNDTVSVTYTVTLASASTFETQFPSAAISQDYVTALRTAFISGAETYNTSTQTDNEAKCWLNMMVLYKGGNTASVHSSHNDAAYQYIPSNDTDGLFGPSGWSDGDLSASSAAATGTNKSLTKILFDTGTVANTPGTSTLKPDRYYLGCYSSPTSLGSGIIKANAAGYVHRSRSSTDARAKEAGMTLDQWNSALANSNGSKNNLGFRRSLTVTIN